MAAPSIAPESTPPSPLSCTGRPARHPGAGGRRFDAEVADVVATALRPTTDGPPIAALRRRVSDLAARHPLYPSLEETP